MSNKSSNELQEIFSLAAGIEKNYSIYDEKVKARGLPPRLYATSQWGTTIVNINGYDVARDNKGEWVIIRQS